MDPAPTTDRPPLIVVQASVGSSRLPNQPLIDIGGVSLLSMQLQRLLPLTAHQPATVVVATSDQVGDDPIVDVAERHGVPVVRGADGDVLGQFAIALVWHPADAVVRIGSGCPLLDPFVVAAALDLHHRERADYTSNLLPRSYPAGLDVEVLSARALRAAELEATGLADRREVTPYVVRQPERFRIANLLSGHDLADERWIVDTVADLDRMREIVGMVPDPLTASWNRILSVVGRSNKPRPGQLVLRPQPGEPTGSSPWIRRWSVVVDGNPIGNVTVGAGAGKVTRDVLVPDAWVEPTREALYRLLLEDPQTGS